MPHLFPFAGHGQEDALQETVGIEPAPKLSRRQSLMKSMGGILKRHREHVDSTQPTSVLPEQTQPQPEFIALPRQSSVPEKLNSKKPPPSLPREQTLKRQNSEKRERLLEIPQHVSERRASSAGDRRRGWSVGAARRPRSPKQLTPSVSAPDVTTPDKELSCNPDQITSQDGTSEQNHEPVTNPSEPTPNDSNELCILDEHEGNDEDEIDQAALQEEYDRRWVLNLSMHFRDRSNREKFFVTYAEEPNKWRRLTISIDYRDAPPESLEADLNSLHYQRDKSFRIFEAIRESLPDIQYYSTVTNLKLETTPEDNQLHVHVREDSNEIIQYPSVSLVEHVQCPRYREGELAFDSHLSGFVYKVRINGALVIKKEIPGPDTVDEFLYEVNALEALVDRENVTQLRGIITDDSESVVKGLLISYASQGALVDMLYDYAGELSWHRREKWAKQIVQGLSSIHEAGFVQGDFTLSNIVVDEDDNAQIIDINRRGCPVGWEPPELSRLIESGQRIGMHISVKTDVYQLGMVLWALAEESDEPERARPLPPLRSPVPDYYRRMVDTCLQEKPQGRASATRLLGMFPRDNDKLTAFKQSVNFRSPSLKDSNPSVSTSHRSDKEYIDPRFAVTIDEVQNEQRRRADTGTSHFTSGQVTYVDPESNPASTSYHFESSGSWIIGRRGRSPVSSRRRRSSPFGRTATSATSLSLSPDRGESKSVRNYVHDDDEPTEVVEFSAEPDTIDSSPASTSGVKGRPSHSPIAVDRRLAGVAREHASQYNPPVHQDSGFDEQMLEDLHLEDSVVPKERQLGDDPRINVGSQRAFNQQFSGGASRSNDSKDQHSRDECEPVSAGQDIKGIMPPELPTPGSFHSASESPFISLQAQPTQELEVPSIECEDAMAAAASLKAKPRQ